MNPKIGFALAAALMLAAAAPRQAGAQAVAETQAGPAPSSSYVWMSGHWNSENGQWRWVAARWELPPARNALWVGGHWAAEAGKWAWVNGAWNISDQSQALGEAPEPPSQPGMPVPSSPPPLPVGDFQSTAAVNAAQVAPITTDYGPIDYSAGGPGYYWAGDPYWSAYPWAWGYPGGYVGLGWGPAYFNYGYGGRGRGYSGHGYYRGGPGRAGGRAPGGHFEGAAPTRGGSSGRPGGGAGYSRH